MNLVLGLVWRNADGSHTEEAWQYLGATSVDDACAAACIDGVAGEFGRVFVGVGSVTNLDDHDGWNSRRVDGAIAHPRPAGLVAAEPVSPRLNPIEDGAWWRFVCAFGTGTLVGVQLRRCLSVDVDVANGAADIVGEAVAHQMTLYDVTPTAALAMGALLDHVAPPVRETLAAWLDVIAEQSAESADGEEASDGDLRHTFLAEGMPEWLVDDLVARATVSIAGAKGCRVSFMLPLFDGLEARGRLGPATVALRRSLRGLGGGQ